MITDRPGFVLPLLLLGGFRSLVDDLHAELSRHGHEQARPVHGFALQAIGPDGVTVSELGRRLGVTKQAAAKTAANLVDLGYAVRTAHPDDRRAATIRRSERGIEMLTLSAAIFDRLRQRWADQIGPDRVDALESDLSTVLAGANTTGAFADLPGWLH